MTGNPPKKLVNGRPYADYDKFFVKKPKLQLYEDQQEEFCDLYEINEGSYEDAYKPCSKEDMISRDDLVDIEEAQKNKSQSHDSQHDFVKHDNKNKDKYVRFFLKNI